MHLRQFDGSFNLKDNDVKRLYYEFANQRVTSHPFHQRWEDEPVVDAKGVEEWVEYADPETECRPTNDTGADRIVGVKGSDIALGMQTRVQTVAPMSFLCTLLWVPSSFAFHEPPKCGF